MVSAESGSIELVRVYDTIRLWFPIRAEWIAGNYIARGSISGWYLEYAD